MRRDDDGTHLVIEPRTEELTEPVKLYSDELRRVSELSARRLRALGFDPDQLPNAPSPVPCWALQAGEICDGSRHSDGRYARACPAHRSRETARDLGWLLERYMPPSSHWDDGQRIGERLFSTFETWRPVQVSVNGEPPKGLEVARGLAQELAADPRRRNNLWRGGVGLGKTHLHVAAFFSALEAGYNVVWLWDQRFMELINALASFDEAVSAKARSDWRALLSAQAVFYSDLASDEHPAAKPGRPLLASKLLELLEYGQGRFHATTNLDPEALRAHADVQVRAVSRILSAHRGEPPISCRFIGEDQRLAWLT